MGCVFGKVCDPRVPDPSVRHHWHVDGIIIDDGEKSEQRRAGLVYILDEAVCYKPRRLDCRKKGEPMSVEIANVKNTSKGKAYTDEATGRQIKKNVIWLETKNNSVTRNIGLLDSRNIDKTYSEMSDIISKHRQKPKIFQYNSVDIDGVEIEPV
ncbi:hypothetical protein WR25_23295 [Diploscapter pachys]|uniref:Uncharacterized protein n=1 Tax=Diploscapter pachys TaxID=2018661 RepID=A0A2A2J7N0_9BILA|nr:hypothetical protein WR25_23295 [Diploscapter pachys]